MSNTLIVVDGNNYFRRKAATTLDGSPVRFCFHDLHNKDATVICVWDGFNATKKRKELYPEYKAKRNKEGLEDIYASQKLLQQLLELSKVTQIRVDGFEGDDVIAYLVERYRKQFAKIYIESNDQDLYQLGCPMSRDRFDETPQRLKLYKTFVGDTSDNIPGCVGFGETSWKKLTEHDKDVLEHIIVSGWGLTMPEIEEKVKAFFPPRALRWFLNADNQKQLRVYYQIIGFLPVPEEAISKSVTPGLNRPDLAENIMKEFMF